MAKKTPTSKLKAEPASKLKAEPASKLKVEPASKKRAAPPGGKHAKVPVGSTASAPAVHPEEPSAADRIKRPPLPRTEPIRSWSTLFGAPSASATSAPPFGIPGLPNIPGIAGPPGMNGAAGVGPEAVRRGVEMGYRVVDEYMKQGASVANAFSNPNRSRSASSASGAEPDLSKMTERMMQYASDFTSLWYDAMGMMMGTMSQQARPDA